MIPCGRSAAKLSQRMRRSAALENAQQRWFRRLAVVTGALSYMAFAVLLATFPETLRLHFMLSPLPQSLLSALPGPVAALLVVHRLLAAPVVDLVLYMAAGTVAMLLVHLTSGRWLQAVRGTAVALLGLVCAKTTVYLLLCRYDQMILRTYVACALGRPAVAPCSVEGFTPSAISAYVLGYLPIIAVAVLALTMRRRRRGHCAHCGYSLRGLTEDRCPECGTVFAGPDGEEHITA